MESQLPLRHELTAGRGRGQRKVQVERPQCAQSLPLPGAAPEHEQEETAAAAGQSGGAQLPAIHPQRQPAGAQAQDARIGECECVVWVRVRRMGTSTWARTSMCVDTEYVYGQTIERAWVQVIWLAETNLSAGRNYGEGTNTTNTTTIRVYSRYVRTCTLYFYCKNSTHVVDMSDEFNVDNRVAGFWIITRILELKNRCPVLVNESSF